MLYDRGIITHYTFYFGPAMLQHPFFVGLLDFGKQFEQKSTEMYLRDKYFRNELSLRFVLLLNLGHSESGLQIGIDRTFRIFFADFSFLDLSNRRTVFMGVNRLQLNAVVNRIISKATEFVLGVIFGSLSILVRTFYE